MSENPSNSKRIAKNTLYLYIRTLFVMAVSIYTSRVVLQTLGIKDFGIYNVVGGFVAMFSMVKNTLSGACQRFYAYEIGIASNNLKRVFSASLSIHFILALCVCLLMETIGLWFINTKMNIPIDRMSATNWVYQCSIITFCINLISIPYNAIVVAHERMHVFAYISVYEVVAKLAVVYLLTLFGYDKLIIYAILILLVASSIRLIYGIYCNRNFAETRTGFTYDKKLYMKLLSFCGWNFFGTTAGIINTQGINLLINLFFGVTLNAARGVADQINHAVNQFVSNFILALNPQITKSYATKDYEYTGTLINRGTKYAVLLLWLISLPVIIKVDYILGIWLVEIPPYAPLFVRLSLFYAISNSLAVTLYYGILATGEIKKYHLIVSGINILCFPVTYILYKTGFPAEWGYITAILFNLMMLFARIKLLGEHLPNFTLLQYFRVAFMRIFIVMVVTGGISYGLNIIIETPNESVSFLCFLPLCLLLTFSTIYFIGLDMKEKRLLLTYIKKRIK